MKKILLLLLILLMTSAMVLNISAAEGKSKENDSNVVLESTKTELGVFNDEQVQAIYNIPLRYAFTKYNNIDDILSSDLVLDVVYRITSENKSTVHKVKRNDRYEEIDATPLVNVKAISAFQNLGTIKVLTKDIKVENIYYLTGEAHYEGTAVYYVTDKGDFVYYTHYDLDNGEYLFPVSDFCKYQKAISASIDPNLDGGIDISSVWDLSVYDINSDTFAPLSNVGNADIDQNDNKSDNNGVVNQGVANNSNLAIPSESSKPLNTILWIGVPCVVILMAVGMVFGVNRRKG